MKIKKLVWWNAKTGTLEPDLNRAQLCKVIKLDRLKKIVRFSDWWVVYPIQGYNVSKYTIRCESGAWTCNCMYAKRYGRTCSHILAVKLFEGIISANRGLSTGAEDV